MHYLVTGGAGFIGSHLSEYLITKDHHVTVIDDLSTGRFNNLARVHDHPGFRMIVGSIRDEALIEPLIRESDGIFHLASAVGVRLIMEQPVQTIETIFHGTDVVLRFASRYRRKILLTSTSEVYGKSNDVPFHEDGDRLEGPTTLHRWAYACAKALDEFLALAHHKTTGLPVVVVRLFNTVGPRQSAQYGMVIPRFVEAALQGRNLTVYGDGLQTRCFCHVHDVVEGLYAAINTPACEGQVINIGNDEEVSIVDLAQRIISTAASNSTILHIPYEQAFPDGGYEDMRRRVPSLEKARRLIGWAPRYRLTDIIRDTIDERREYLRISA